MTKITIDSSSRKALAKIENLDKLTREGVEYAAYVSGKGLVSPLKSSSRKLSTTRWRLASRAAHSSTDADASTSARTGAFASIVEGGDGERSALARARAARAALRRSTGA